MMALKWIFNFKKPVRIENIDDGICLGPQNGPTVIFIHGLTGTPNEIKFLANFFFRKGYSAVCPRLENHGQPLDILKHTPWEAFYESVRKAYLKLETRGPIFAAGLSMGALLALLLAEEFPDRIAGVSCLSPTLFYDGWNVPWWTQTLLPLAYYTPLRYFA